MSTTLSESKRAMLQQRLQAARSAVANVGEKQRTIPSAAGSADARPLSFMQQQLWFLDRLVPGSPAYNVFEAVRIKGRGLSVPALERSLAAIVQRHEVLRSTYRIRGAEVLQSVSPAPEFRLGFDDLRHLDAATREAEAQSLAREEARRPFDLANDLMLRARLLRLAEDDHLLLINMHHVAADGWSLGVLYQELSSIYGAEVEGRKHTLPDLPIQFSDFAAWQRRALNDEKLQSQLAYWKDRLAGAPDLVQLPADYPRPQQPTFLGALEWFTISAGTVERLKALAKAESATLFMVLAAAFKTLLHRYTGQTDIVVGSTVAGRNFWETEPIIGPFINALPLRTDLSGDPTFRALVSRVRATLLDGYAHQDVPLELIVQEMKSKRSVRHLPLFQTMLIMQSVPTHGFNVPGFVSHRMEIDNGSSKFDLTLSMTETPAGLVTSCEYSTDLFEAETIREWIGHFQALLRAAAEAPDTPLSALPPKEIEFLDRRNAQQLLQPAANEPARISSGTAPRNPTEERLAEIWSEVLKVPTVSVDDDFFALGGHSILAIQVMARVRETFECDVPVRHLFESPTIAQLAAKIEEKLLEDIQGLSDEEAERLSSGSLARSTP